MLAQMEHYNCKQDLGAETFIGNIFLTEEDFHEYEVEQHLQEQDFPQGW